MMIDKEKYTIHYIENILLTKEQLNNLDYDAGYDIALALHDGAWINFYEDERYVSGDELEEKLIELGIIK